MTSVGVTSVGVTSAKTISVEVTGAEMLGRPGSTRDPRGRSCTNRSWPLGGDVHSGSLRGSPSRMGCVADFWNGTIRWSARRDRDMDENEPAAVPEQDRQAEEFPFRPPARRPWLHRIVPVAEHLPGYHRESLGRDALAGATVAALALPAGMAYAELAGLSPVNGLYALLLPAVAYAVFGSARTLIVGPEGAIATMVGAALIPLTQDPGERASLAALLALLVGAAYLIALVARLGWIADYLSLPVLIGYIHGVAVVMIVSQLAKLLGLSISAESPQGQVVEVVQEIGQANPATAVVGISCLVLLLVARRLLPRFPTPLIVVVLAIAASAALGLAQYGVAVIGDIPAGLPSLSLPDFHLRRVLDILPAALGIFVVGFSDEILTARSFAGRRGQHVRADAELAAMGAGNLAAGISQGFPVGASGSRTAVNDQIGGRTQFSGLIAAGIVALVLLSLTAPMQYLPKAVLGAVIISASVGLFDRVAWRGLARVSRVEVGIAVTTMVGVIVLGVLPALLLAVALSVADAIRRSAKPHDAVLGRVERLDRYADVRLHPSATRVPGVLVYRLDDRLFFANANYVQSRIREAIAGSPTPVHWLVFDAEGLNHVDATGIDLLTTLVESLRKESITFVFARLKSPMADHLREAGLIQLVGDDHLYPTVHAAVDDAPASA
jgi:high affinity sulfate transporter 1